MSFLDVLQNYFQGEKQVGVGLAVVGVLLLGVVVWVWRTQTGGFAWGLAAPLLVAGLAFSGGGVFLAARSDKQITELSAQYTQNPETLVKTERERMTKVNANWPIIKMVWTAVIVCALVLLEIVRREWASGLGLSLLLLMTVLFFTDVFAERRAIIYTQALDADSATRASQN